MIDESKTLYIYGYTSDELKPKSSRPIIIICDKCGVYRDSTMYSYRELCRSCANKKRFEDPELRKKASESAIKRWADPAEHEKASEAAKKRFEDPSERAKASKAQTKRGRSPEERKRRSETTKKYYEDPLNHEKQSAAMKKRYEDPEAREKNSAAQQGIPYTEWKAFAKEQRYCPKFNNAIKQYIRDKYNNCDYISGVHKDVCNGCINLDVHHVDYNKEQGCDDHEWRLIPLSSANHARTNANRSFWNRLFTYALQYDETYYEDCASAHNIKVVSN